MGQFTTTVLTGQRVLVEGTDVRGNEGSTVVSSAEWDDVNAHVEYDQAVESFDDAVKEFFAPVLTAAEALEGKLGKTPDDPSSYVVVHEKVEATPGHPGQIVRLSRDSVVLRLIAEGQTDRLVWVNDELEVTAPAPAPSTPVEADSTSE